MLILTVILQYVLRNVLTLARAHVHVHQQQQTMSIVLQQGFVAADFIRFLFYFGTHLSFSFQVLHFLPLCVSHQCRHIPGFFLPLDNHFFLAYHPSSFDNLL